MLCFRCFFSHRNTCFPKFQEGILHSFQSLSRVREDMLTFKLQQALKRVPTHSNKAWRFMLKVLHRIKNAHPSFLHPKTTHCYCWLLPPCDFKLNLYRLMENLKSSDPARLPPSWRPWWKSVLAAGATGFRGVVVCPLHSALRLWARLESFASRCQLGLAELELASRED